MKIIKTVEGLFSIIHLKPLRETPGVTFDLLPAELFKKTHSVDRVIHHASALSPGPVDGVERPWYMHPEQSDNLAVLNGTRHVELYTPAHGSIEAFVVTAKSILQNGKTVSDEPSMLIWPSHVFHRVRSYKEGSASVNFAIHHEGFDIKTNFNIYDVNTETGEYSLLREGHLDQF